MISPLSMQRAVRVDLQRAGIERQWELHYQPQVALQDETLGGFEALLRWRHPERGLLAPRCFLPALERSPVAHEVGRWVLDEACRQLAAWRSAGCAVPRVSVNLFAAQFQARTLEDDVRTVLDRHRLVPSDLEIELTETIALDAKTRTLDGLCRLMRAGMGIALDDFGTGFASLDTLKRCPVSRLKIDRSFVRDLCEDAKSRAIVGAVLAIGRELSIDVIAEGVETAAQRERLRALGCRWGQGYLFSKPRPPRAFHSSPRALHAEYSL